MFILVEKVEKYYKFWNAVGRITIQLKFRTNRYNLFSVQSMNYLWSRISRYF